MMKQKKIENTRQLREFLSEQMNAIVDGQLDNEKSRGIANLAQQIYNTLNIEMKHATLKVKYGDEIKLEPVEFK